MKKVVLMSLLGAMAMVNDAWAQTPDARPATVQPGTIALLDTMARVAKNQTATPAPKPLLQFFQTPAPPAAPRPPATAAPARPPAAPSPGSAPPAPVPAEPPPPPNAQQLARMMGNVRFDVTITDTGSGPKPVTKTVSLTVSPGSNGSIRSSAKAEAPGPINNMNVTQPVSWLNVDIRNVIALDTNSVRASISVEYQAYFPDAKVQPGAITASSTSAMTDGRRTQILVTSDPVSDRRTTIEVTATVIK